MSQRDPAIRDFEIMPLSERCALVSFGNVIDQSVNEKVLFLHRALLHSAFEGFVESVPAYASLAVFYDFLQVTKSAGANSFLFVKHYLEHILQADIKISKSISAPIKIPVCYDSEFGPDIDRVAEGHGLSADEVVRLHTSVIYRVYMVGFMPGFAYMGTVDEKLVTPRKDQPRLHVPAGSVGIAGSQTGIYPIDSPGGWQIIGRTPLQLFNADMPTPCLLSAGDQIQFVSIDKEEFLRTDVH